jgi:UDP-N-acetylglucosamine 2-epimerase (non-hydrolysing)
MKIAPIHREMGKYPGLKPLLIHTGQHYDKKMSKLFFQDLLLPEPDVYLGVGSGTHTEQTARIMLDFEKVMEEQKPDLVLVVGDVNSTAACSLVAAKMQTKIAHVEAGLRSFDRTMPEEINRMITDALSDFLFVTEKSGLENLKNEGIPDNKVFFTGNVMIDSLKFFLEKARESSILSDLQVNGSPFALVTLHRPSNVDVKENLENLFYTFSVIGKEVKIVFPMHPRTKKMIDTFDLENYVASIENLIITDPVGYLDFMQLMQNARLILTDSGGIQEETTVLVGPKADRIIHETEKIISGNGKKGKIPELWDGNAAERIVRILAEKL